MKTYISQHDEDEITKAIEVLHNQMVDAYLSKILGRMEQIAIGCKETKTPRILDIGYKGG